MGAAYSSIDRYWTTTPAANLTGESHCHVEGEEVSRHTGREAEQNYQTAPADRSSPMRRTPSLNEALTNAFASDEDESSILPERLYRRPTRPRSRGSSQSSGFPEPRTPPLRQDSSDSIDSATSQSSTGTFGGGPDKSYSPLAAGFARLGQREIDTSGSLSAAKGRWQSRRPLVGLGLDAEKMFGGSA